MKLHNIFIIALINCPLTHAAYRELPSIELARKVHQRHTVHLGARYLKVDDRLKQTIILESQKMYTKVPMNMARMHSLVTRFFVDAYPEILKTLSVASFKKSLAQYEIDQYLEWFVRVGGHFDYAGVKYESQPDGSLQAESNGEKIKLRISLRRSASNDHQVEELDRDLAFFPDVGLTNVTSKLIHAPNPDKFIVGTHIQFGEVQISSTDDYVNLFRILAKYKTSLQRSFVDRTLRGVWPLPNGNYMIGIEEVKK